ncbi:SDR family NAD(P)-dependent oxidoreductase [Rhodococcus sp. NPDC057014]|uniref:SDR family NAD(P)-dependent oxidoreductase n=1 Tax=Rhodococcus sp. NPDC057014 TaxID=3346000 RepID=UPI00362B2E34
MTEFRSVAGKTAIVTGSSRGIGEGIADTLAAEGVHVVLADIRPEVKETAAKLAAAHPDVQVHGQIVDVSDESAVEQLVGFAVATFGRLDIMANNAGIHVTPANVWDTDMADVDRVMAVNFKGIFHGCKHAARQMIKQKSGSIVNTGSFFGKVGHPGSAAYGATKNAVHTLTMSLSQEIAPYGVNVNALCPGLAATEMHWAFVEADAKERGITFEEMKEIELKEIPLGRYGYGSDLAGAIMWLASKSGSYVTGQSININGGLDFS